MTASRRPFRLHALFDGQRQDSWPVCHDGQRVLHWSEFAGAVSARADQVRCRPEKRWLLTGGDTALFAIDLFALLYAEKTVVVPPNAQEGCLAALADRYDARMSDLARPAKGVEGGLASIDPHSAVIDLYTSGSAGEPKRVRKTLAQFQTEVDTLEALWGEELGDAAVTATSPHQHIYGLLFRLFWPLAAGRLFDAVTCANPAQLGDRLRAFDAVAMVSSPAQLSRLPDLVDLSQWLPCPRFIFSSGGPLSREAALRFADALGQAPIEVFGSTETGGIAWRSRNADDISEAWTPFPGMTIRCSENGALVLRSPYLDGMDELETEDGVALLPDGRFRLLGRLDRVAKIEEKRVSLPDMEARLCVDPRVAEAAVVVLPGRRQRLAGVVVLNDEGERQLAEIGRDGLGRSLRMFLAAYYDKVLVPRRWRFVVQLPVNERGKTVAADLVRLFEAGGGPLMPEVVAVHRPPGEVNAVMLELSVVPELVHFSGHFPSMPILPGVVEVDWAVRYAREYLGVDGRFLALENVKFLALVTPGKQLHLRLEWDPVRHNMAFSYADAHRKYATGRIAFGGA